MWETVFHSAVRGVGGEGAPSGTGRVLGDLAVKGCLPSFVDESGMYCFMVQSLGSGVTCLGLNLFVPSHPLLENGYHNSTQLNRGSGLGVAQCVPCALQSTSKSPVKAAKIVSTHDGPLEMKAGPYAGSAVRVLCEMCELCEL